MWDAVDANHVDAVLRVLTEHAKARTGVDAIVPSFVARTAAVRTALEQLADSRPAGAYVSCGGAGVAGASVVGVAAAMLPSTRAVYVMDVFDDVDAAVDEAAADADDGGPRAAQYRDEDVERVRAAASARPPATFDADTLRRGLARVSLDKPHVHVYEHGIGHVVHAKRASIGPVALLHIGADSYAGTWRCLIELLPQVSANGCVTWAWRGVAWRGVRACA